MGASRPMVGALQLGELVARDRVTHYRLQAARLREIAEHEPIRQIGAQLMQVAREYELLADSIVCSRSASF